MSKYFFTFVFSLGILLTPFYRPVIVYECNGPEMFPTYYGCPFIYKATNLGTSLAWDFFFWPALANIVIWLTLFLLLRLVIYKTILKNRNTLVKHFYVAVKCILTVYFLFWIAISLTYEGHSLQSNVDFENEAKAWNMTCEGHISLTEYTKTNLDPL